MNTRLLKYFMLLSCFLVGVDLVSSGAGRRGPAPSSDSDSDSEDKEDATAGAGHGAGEDEEDSSSDDDSDRPGTKLNSACEALVMLYNEQFQRMSNRASEFDPSSYGIFLKGIESDERDFAREVFDLFPITNIKFLVKPLMAKKGKKPSDHLFTDHAFYLGFSSWNKLANDAHDSKATISNYYSILAALADLQESELEETPSRNFNVMKSFAVGCLTAANVTTITKRMVEEKIIDERPSLTITFKSMHAIQENFNRGSTESGRFWDNTAAESQRSGGENLVSLATKSLTDVITLERNILSIKLDQLAHHSGMFFGDFFSNTTDSGCEFWKEETRVYQRKLFKQLKQKIEQKIKEDKLLASWEPPSSKPLERETPKPTASQKTAKLAAAKKKAADAKDAQLKKEAREKDAELAAELERRLQLATKMSASYSTEKELAEQRRAQEEISPKLAAPEPAASTGKEQQKIIDAARKHQEALAAQRAAQEKIKLGLLLSPDEAALLKSTSKVAAHGTSSESSASSSIAPTSTDSRETDDTPALPKDLAQGVQPAPIKAKGPKRGRRKKQKPRGGPETFSDLVDAVKLGEIMAGIIEDPANRFPLESLSPRQKAVLVGFQDVLYRKKIAQQTHTGPERTPEAKAAEGSSSTPAPTVPQE